MSRRGVIVVAVLALVAMAAMPAGAEPASPEDVEVEVESSGLFPTPQVGNSALFRRLLERLLTAGFGLFMNAD